MLTDGSEFQPREDFAVQRTDSLQLHLARRSRCGDPRIAIACIRPRLPPIKPMHPRSQIDYEPPVREPNPRTDTDVSIVWYSLRQRITLASAASRACLAFLTRILKSSAKTWVGKSTESGGNVARRATDLSFICAPLSASAYAKLFVSSATLKGSPRRARRGSKALCRSPVSFANIPKKRSSFAPLRASPY